jgi:hypothetical protein
LVAVFEIISGLGGLYLSLGDLLGIFADPRAAMLWYGVFPLLTFIAGVVLWRQMKFAIGLSVLVQLLQLPVIKGERLSLNLGAAMKFSLSGIWCAGDGCRVMLVLGINVSALVMLAILLSCWSDPYTAPTV